MLSFQDNGSVDELPSDVGTLKNIIIDLTRRLQNANHTIESQQQRLNQSSHLAEIYRMQVNELSNALRLETSKNTQLNRKQMKAEESRRFEMDKKKTTEIQEEIRLAIIDQAVKGSSRETNKIGRMRAQLSKLEVRQDSQQRLLEQLKVMDDAIDEFAAHAFNGNLEACHQMLLRGFSVNEVDSAGFLPLHYACTNGHLEVVQLLLEFGADCSSSIIGSNPVETAAATGNLELIELLVEFGASIHDHGAGGSPPIVVAANANQVECVAFLLELGADVNACDSSMNNSLHAGAKIFDSPGSLIKLLLLAGGNTKATNSKGLTPLHLALNLNNIEAIEAFGGRNKSADELAMQGQLDESNILPLSPSNLKKLQSDLTKRPSDVVIDQPPLSILNSTVSSKLVSSKRNEIRGSGKPSPAKQPSPTMQLSIGKGRRKNSQPKLTKPSRPPQLPEEPSLLPPQSQIEVPVPGVSVEAEERGHVVSELYDAGQDLAVFNSEGDCDQQFVNA